MAIRDPVCTGLIPRATVEGTRTRIMAPAAPIPDPLNVASPNGMTRLASRAGPGRPTRLLTTLWINPLLYPFREKTGRHGCRDHMRIRVSGPFKELPRQITYLFPRCQGRRDTAYQHRGEDGLRLIEALHEQRRMRGPEQNSRGTNGTRTLSGNTLNDLFLRFPKSAGAIAQCFRSQRTARYQ